MSYKIAFAIKSDGGEFNDTIFDEWGDMLDYLDKNLFVEKLPITIEAVVRVVS